MALPIDECDEYRDNGLTQQLGFIRTCEWKWPDFLAPFLKIKIYDRLIFQEIKTDDDHAAIMRESF